MTIKFTYPVKIENDYDIEETEDFLVEKDDENGIVAYCSDYVIQTMIIEMMHKLYERQSLERGNKLLRRFFVISNELEELSRDIFHAHNGVEKKILDESKKFADTL